MERQAAREMRSLPPGNLRILRRRSVRRLEIVRAAGKAFGVRGFAETGMRDIAAAADISTASLYNYFKGKHELLFFCQVSSLEQMMGALDKARRSRASAATKLCMVIESHMRCVLDEVGGSTAHLQTNGLTRILQQRLIAQRDRYERGIRSLIVSGMRSGEFISCDASLITRAILGAANWSVRWFHPEGPLNAGEVAREFARYLIRGLTARKDPMIKTRFVRGKRKG